MSWARASRISESPMTTTSPGLAGFRLIPGEVSGASQLGQLEDAHGNCAQRFAKRLPERAPVPRVGPALVVMSRDVVAFRVLD